MCVCIYSMWTYEYLQRGIFQITVLYSRHMEASVNKCVCVCVCVCVGGGDCRTDCFELMDQNSYELYLTSKDQQAVFMSTCRGTIPADFM